jgi:mono/diheme cytochrome c family protein
MNAMRRFTHSSLQARRPLLAFLLMAILGLAATVASLADLPDNAVTLDQVMRGRLLVVSHDCGTCHNRGGQENDPASPLWLAGLRAPGQPFHIGPFNTNPKNLTPDPETGMGTFTARQIFNALRYGLDPDKTPDAVITSNTPGQGNFPATPYYLAPPMPWPAWRHMTDAELWDVIAYLQHGIKPVSNKVPDSQEPADHWASTYTPDKIGRYPLPAYPSGNEEFRP